MEKYSDRFKDADFYLETFEEVAIFGFKCFVFFMVLHVFGAVFTELVEEVVFKLPDWCSTLGL